MCLIERDTLFMKFINAQIYTQVNCIQEKVVKLSLPTPSLL